MHHSELTVRTILTEIAPSSFMFDFGRYIIAASLMVALVWVLRRTGFASRKLQAREATMTDMRREFLSSIRTCLIYISVTLIMVWGSSVGIFQRFNGGLGLATDIALLAGIIIGHDAYFYWVHRTMHHPRLFKTFHRHHHRSITPTPWAAYSFSWQEAFVMAMFVPIWQFFVPTPGYIMLIFLGFQIIRNVMGHAGLELMPRWWLSTPLTKWLNTTTHHDLHHDGSFNHNYGLYFTWWDKLMGTEHPDYHARFDAAVARPVEAETVMVG
jgi:Delta7-sterol 5-desaturase